MGANVCLPSVVPNDLAVGRAGVGELVPGVGVLEVPPQTRHLSREIVVAVFLGHNLQ